MSQPKNHSSIIQKLEKEFVHLKNKLLSFGKDLQEAKKVMPKDAVKKPVSKAAVTPKTTATTKKPCVGSCKKAVATKPKTAKTIATKKKTIKTK